MIAPHVRRTPLIEAVSPIAGAPPVSLKLEFLQHAGSFKPRGAFYNLLTRAAPPVGCATASGGNHGAAVAYADGEARRQGARCSCRRSPRRRRSPRSRLTAPRSSFRAAAYADAQALCDAYVAESGALAIHPYATAATIAGQGTVGLEWEEDLARLGLPPIDTALVAVGGGGLVAGVAAWFDRRVKVVGVEPEGSRSSTRRSPRDGRSTCRSSRSPPILQLGARSVGALNLAIARRAVDHVALVADAAISSRAAVAVARDADRRRAGRRSRLRRPGERRLSTSRRRTGRRAGLRRQCRPRRPGGAGRRLKRDSAGAAGRRRRSSRSANRRRPKRRRSKPAASRPSVTHRPATEWPSPARRGARTRRAFPIE